MKRFKINILFVFFCFSTGILLGQEKPNILWITIEDTSPQFIGCYGNTEASTPVIDKLANEGVKFTNAFSTGTVCSPSRSTIITGVPTYKMGTGHHRSAYPIPDFIHGFPYYLKQQGYYTSNNFKTDYNVAKAKQFTKDAWDESSNKAGWWKAKPGQPFFAVFNYIESHQSRTMTKSYEWYQENIWQQLPDKDRIADNAFKMPPFYKDSPEMRKQFARVYNAIKLTDNRIGELLQKLEDDNLRDETIIFLYADHGEGIPRGKTNGINLGYRVPFIVWFPEKYKHLSPWGTLGVVTSELVNFEDLAPTLLSLAGSKIPSYMEGRILMTENRSKAVEHLNLSADRSDNGPDLVRSVTNGKYMYSRNFMPFMPEARYIRYVEISDIKQQMRSDLANNKLNTIQKSMFKDRPAEFLFDIENDLWETVNLIDSQKHKEILRSMRKKLKTEIIKTRDVHFLPEYEIGLISRLGKLYEFRLDDSKFPIKTIYKAASLSGKRSKIITEKQVRLLHNKNKIVRYWAIVGLRSQNVETLEPYKNEIINAMVDSYAPVAVTAAAITYQNFRNKDSEDKLKAFCKSQNMDIALMAINYLLYVENKQPFIEIIKAVHNMPNRTYNVKAACMDFLGSLGLVPNNDKNES
jgi:arylsulfatase A-like enzyme